MTGTDPSRGLPDELRELGRGLPVPPVDGESMAERVLARLIAESVPAPVPEAPPGRARRLLDRARRGRRSLGVVLSGALVALVLTPPVRAAVVDWFGFGGVEVRYTPSAPPPPRAGVPACRAPLPLGEAGRRAGFAPPVPRSLGEPDAVSLTAVPGGRFAIALCWYEPTGTVRLDAFPARLGLGFSKQVRVLPEWLELSGGRTALWFEEPHVLRFPLTDGTGRQWTEARRTAGPTLLWTSADGLTTLRLEGVAEREGGRAVAESLR